MARQTAPKATRNQCVDFVIPELGRAAPYGVYDLANNSGWVSVGVDHDTSAFAVSAVGGTECNNPTRKQPSFSSPPTPSAMDREYGFEG